MRRRIMTPVIALAIALGVVFTPTASVLATTNYTSGQIYTAYVYQFTNPRYVSAGGSNFYFNKADGPAMAMAWWKCSDSSVAGPLRSISNADPAGYVTLDTNFRQGANICLKAISYGNNSSDLFEGTVLWNVYSL